VDEYSFDNYIPRNDNDLRSLQWSKAGTTSGQINANGSAFIFYDSVTDNFGNEYSHGIGGIGWDSNSSPGRSWQEYEIDGAYKEIKGRIVLDYEARSVTDSDGFYIMINCDREFVYRSPYIKSGSDPIDFTIDLSDVKLLRIEIVGKDMIRIVDCQLIALSAEEQEEKRNQELNINVSQTEEHLDLNDLPWYNASTNEGGFYNFEDVRDYLGNTYASGIGGIYDNAQTPNFQEYNINSQYSELRGCIVLDFDAKIQSNMDSVFVSIYSDGELVYQSPNIREGVEPIDFSIDLINVERLRIEIIGSSMIRVVNGVVIKK